jgi:hypothetical protein
MNLIFPPSLKKLYRKEPISSFIITVGAVDALLGGFNENGSLLILGFLVAGMALGYRWWQIGRSRSMTEPMTKDRPRQLYLPERSSQTPLGNLDDF